MTQASLFLFALLFLTVQGRGHPKWNGMHPQDFVEYGADVTPLIQSQDENLKDVAPAVTVLSSVPEPVSGKTVWPSLKELAYRNSKSAHIFKLQAAYMISDGLSYGCRKKKGNTDVAVNSDMCNKHCTHKGRYCPAELPDLLEQRTKTHGRMIIAEIVRRLCWGSVLKGTYANVYWFEYLEGFDEQKCLESDDMATCSIQIIDELGGNANQTRRSEMDTCIAEADKDTDNPNAMLEHQLELLKSIEHSWETLPTLKINEEIYHTGSKFLFRSDHVTKTWCGAFPTDVVSKNTTIGVEHITTPITCDFCGHCNYVARCLWKNQCDGHPFDVNTFHDPKHVTVIKEIEEDVEEVTEGIFKVAISLIVGSVIGASIVLGVLAIQGKHKRRQAIEEMSKNMPMEGRFADEFEEKAHGTMEMTMPGNIPGKGVFKKFRDNAGDDDNAEDDSKPVMEVV